MALGSFPTNPKFDSNSSLGTGTFMPSVATGSDFDSGLGLFRDSWVESLLDFFPPNVEAKNVLDLFILGQSIKDVTFCDEDPWAAAGPWGSPRAQKDTASVTLAAAVMATEKTWTSSPTMAGKDWRFFDKNNKLFGVYWKLVWFLGSLSINDHPGFSPLIQFLQWRRRWWWRWCGLRINSSAHRGCLVELMVKSSFGFFARWIQPWWLMTGYYTNPYDPYVLVLLASTTSSTSNRKFKLVGNFHHLTHPGGDPTLNHPI